MSHEVLRSGYTASESLASAQYRAVYDAGSQTAGEANNGDTGTGTDATKLLGIAKNAPASGEPCQIWAPGSTEVLVAANGTTDIAVGDTLTPDTGNTTGVLIKTTTDGHFYIAIAREAFADNSVGYIRADIVYGQRAS